MSTEGSRRHRGNVRRSFALVALLAALIALLVAGTALAGVAGKGDSATSASSSTNAKGDGDGAGAGKGGAPASTAPAVGKGAGSPPSSTPGGTAPGAAGGTPAARGSTGAHKGTGQSSGSPGGSTTASGGQKGHTTVVTPAQDPSPSATPPSSDPTPTQPPGDGHRPHTPKHHTQPPTHRHHTPSGHGTQQAQTLVAPSIQALLSAATAQRTPAGRAGRPRTGAPAVSGHVDGGAHGSAGAPELVAREIGHVVHVVPTWAWILVGVMLALLLASASVTARLARRVRSSDALVGSMRTAALTDPLTGLLNRRGFADRLERELARARRFGHPLAVAFLDVRGLKAVNDDHGHSAGDAVLRAAAHLVCSSTREEDIVGRIGGDECAVALIEQDRAGAVAFARRIAAAVPSARDELGTLTDWDLTVGVAVFPEDGETAEALLAAADRRLYLRRGIALSATRTPKE